MTFKDRLLGRDYIFETKPGLFSKDKIDDGTRLLVESIHMSEALTSVKNPVLLDLGCGYGVIGIVAANLAKSGKVYMVDTDIRAVKCAKINAKLNLLENTETLASDGFEQLESIMFDLVLSNPPTHLPKDVILEFLEGGKAHLKQDGKLYFVTERRIKPFIKREFERIFGNYKEITYGPKHTVSLATNS